MLRIHRVPITESTDVEFAASTLQEFGQELAAHEKRMVAGQHIDTNPDKELSTQGKNIEQLAMYVGTTIFANTVGTTEDRTSLTLSVARDLMVDAFPGIDRGLLGYYESGVMQQIPADLDAEELAKLERQF